MRAPILLLLSALLLICPSCSTSKSRKSLDQLRQQVTAALSEQEGVFAVAFRDLSTGEEMLINGHEAFHAASTMKTPVLIEAYRQAVEGKLALSDSMLIKNEFRSIVDGSKFSIGAADDSEQELYTLVGRRRPISELLYKMIIHSSNLATNLVIEQLDAKKVTQTMRELGAPDIQVLRGVEDIKAYERGLSNTTTAYDLMVIFEQLAKGKAVSAAASEEMVRILLDQQHNDILPARLPHHVKVAHKTGWITGVRHDSGIILLPDGRKYVLVLLSKGLKDEAAGTEAMARVSEMVYKYVTGED